MRLDSYAIRWQACCKSLSCFTVYAEYVGKIMGMLQFKHMLSIHHAVPGSWRLRKCARNLAIRPVTSDSHRLALGAVT